MKVEKSHVLSCNTFRNTKSYLKTNFMKLVLTILLLVVTGTVISQELEKKNYTSNHIQDAEINIDGKLNEPAWEIANWEDHFIQYEPTEGISPYQQTEFAILYDENNVYVALK